MCLSTQKNDKWKSWLTDFLRTSDCSHALSSNCFTAFFLTRVVRTVQLSWRANCQVLEYCIQQVKMKVCQVFNHLWHLYRQGSELKAPSDPFLPVEWPACWGSDGSAQMLGVVSLFREPWTKGTCRLTDPEAGKRKKERLGMGKYWVRV